MPGGRRAPSKPAPPAWSLPPVKRTMLSAATRTNVAASIIARRARTGIGPPVRRRRAVVVGLGRRAGLGRLVGGCFGCISHTLTLDLSLRLDGRRRRHDRRIWLCSGDRDLVEDLGRGLLGRRLGRREQRGKLVEALDLGPGELAERGLLAAGAGVLALGAALLVAALVLLIAPAASAWRFSRSSRSRLGRITCAAFSGSSEAIISAAIAWPSASATSPDGCELFFIRRAVCAARASCLAACWETGRRAPFWKPRTFSVTSSRSFSGKPRKSSLSSAISTWSRVAATAARSSGHGNGSRLGFSCSRFLTTGSVFSSATPRILGPTTSPRPPRRAWCARGARARPAPRPRPAGPGSAPPARLREPQWPPAPASSLGRAAAPARHRSARPQGPAPLRPAGPAPAPRRRPRGAPAARSPPPRMPHRSGERRAGA